MNKNINELFSGEDGYIDMNSLKVVGTHECSRGKFIWAADKNDKFITLPAEWLQHKLNS